jgi:hypothetical protein
MSGKIAVKSHTRRAPEKKPDPFASLNEAKLHRFASKWGLEVVSANDSRLSAPISDPVPGPAPMSLAEIEDRLEQLSKRAAMIGRLL